MLGGFDLDTVVPANGGIINLGTVTRTNVAGAIANSSAGDYQLSSDPNQASIDRDGFAKVGTNPLESAIRSPTLGNCESTTERIDTYLAGDGLERSYDYYRYWHGYAVISRPLLAVVGLAGLRLLSTMALIAMMAGLARSVVRRHGAVTAAVLFLPFVLTTDFIDLGTEFTHAIGVMAILGSSWCAFEVVARDTSISRIATASMIAGALVVFADFLTMPPGGWALCTALSLIHISEPTRPY